MKKLLMHTKQAIDRIGNGRATLDAFNIIQEIRSVNGMSTLAGKKEEALSLKSKITCKTEDIGLESFLICLENKPKKCMFSITFGDRYFCKKPLSLVWVHSLGA